MDDIRRSTKARALRVPTMSDVLCLASRYGNVGLVNSLIAAGVVINERVGLTESCPALIEAVEYKRLKVIEVLLSEGAKIDQQGGQEYGQRAVVAAERSDHTDLVKDLIPGGAKPQSSLPDPERTSTSEGQAPTRGFDVSVRVETGLTATIHEEAQMGKSPALHKWMRTPESHEQLALGILKSASSKKSDSSTKF